MHLQPTYFFSKIHGFGSRAFVVSFLKMPGCTHESVTHFHSCVMRNFICHCTFLPPSNGANLETLPELRERCFDLFDLRSVAEL